MEEATPWTQGNHREKVAIDRTRMAKIQSGWEIHQGTKESTTLLTVNIVNNKQLIF